MRVALSLSWDRIAEVYDEPYWRSKRRSVGRLPALVVREALLDAG